MIKRLKCSILEMVKEMAEDFKSLEELYSRIKPALYSKAEEFRRQGINYIKEEDIWNYLSITSWKNSESLSLADMVETIMSLKLSDMNTYVHDILKKQGREIIREDLL